jgi:formate hydrogenlyase subunit 6/NADH:ubiquinone oxidoreductase subunit I
LFTSIFDAFWHPPETIAYPFDELVLPEGFRGAIEIHPDQCVGCGLCVRNCPTGALKLEKESKACFSLSHFPTRCAYCGECEAVCRYDAIHHTNELVGAMPEPGGWKVLVDREQDEDDS